MSSAPESPTDEGQGATSQQPSRGLTFGSAAEQYERYRPGYPQQVADLVLAAAGRPATTAIEIGTGTGHPADRLPGSRGGCGRA